MESQTIVHLVYIHGFRGNDTTFQSFPTDLQRHLSSLPSIPARCKIQSSLYPTYKSVKPLSHATRNFLEWLMTQPPGPVIVIGHSMGGLLAAEAATDKMILESAPHPAKRRIVALVAFDTPYLGMHPHVVISGISSLLPKGSPKEKGGTTTAKDLNDERKVHIVDQQVTDDWEAFKNRSKEHLRSPVPARSPSPLGSLFPCLNHVDEITAVTTTAATTTLAPPPPAAARVLALLPPSTPSSVVKYVNDHANDPFLRWLGKHSDNLLGDSKKWIVEHFQFGICMFDPQGLRERYKRLARWDAPWVNYWTITTGERVPVAEREKEKTAEKRVEKENDLALLTSGVVREEELRARPVSPTPSIASTASSSSLSLPLSPPPSPKRRSKHHFITLPIGLGKTLGEAEKWVRVPIAGAEDEVAAHTGLFMKHTNPDYDKFVVTVGEWVSKVVNGL